jgi:putative flippase GtrA
MAKTNPASGHKLLDNQVVRFIFSSGTGFVVDIAAYYVFYHYIFTTHNYYFFDFRVPNDTLSLAISFFLGVLVNFFINKFLVFAESKLAPGKQFFRFISVAIIGFFANLGVLKLFIHLLHMYPPVARPLAALSLFFASFFVHKFFSFSLSLRHHAPGRHHTASN